MESQHPVAPLLIGDVGVEVDEDLDGVAQLAVVLRPERRRALIERALDELEEAGDIREEAGVILGDRGAGLLVGL